MDGNSVQLELDYVGSYELFMEVPSIHGVMSNLIDKNFLNSTLRGLTLEFVLFNPINGRGVAYVIIEFDVAHTGVVLNKRITVSSIVTNALSTIPNILVIITSLILLFISLYYLRKIITVLRLKNYSYNMWYKINIMNLLTDS